MQYVFSDYALAYIGRKGKNWIVGKGRKMFKDYFPNIGRLIWALKVYYFVAVYDGGRI